MKSRQYRVGQERKASKTTSFKPVKHVRFELDGTPKKVSAAEELIKTLRAMHEQFMVPMVPIIAKEKKATETSRVLKKVRIKVRPRESKRESTEDVLQKSTNDHARRSRAIKLPEICLSDRKPLETTIRPVVAGLNTFHRKLIRETLFTPILEKAKYRDYCESLPCSISSEKLRKVRRKAKPYYSVHRKRNVNIPKTNTMLTNMGETSKIYSGAFTRSLNGSPNLSISRSEPYIIALKKKQEH